MPRAKAPLEERRRRGRSANRDSGGRELPDQSNVVHLEGVKGGIPDLPPTVGEEGPGAERWTRIWREAKWLSPATDIDIVERICIGEDLVAGMRSALAEEGFYVTGSQGQVRPNPLLAQVRAQLGQMLQMERECGLTPSARGDLGVAEVTDKSNPLEQILQQAAARNAARGS